MFEQKTGKPAAISGCDCVCAVCIFSMLKSLVNAQQDSSFQDYLDTSVILQCNCC